MADQVREVRPDFWGTIGLIFRTATGHWRACLAMSALYAILMGIGNAVTRSATGLVDPTTVTPAEVIAAGVAALAALGMLMLVVVFVLPVTLGALSLVGSASVYGDEIEPQGIVRRALDRALDAVGAGLLLFLIVAAAPLMVGVFGLVVGVIAGPEAGFAALLFGFLLIVIPTVYLYVRLSLAIPTVMREGQGPIGALRRSWKIVGGGWWWVFGISVVMGLAAALANGIVSIFSFLAAGPLGFVLDAVISAIAAAVWVILYGVALGVVYGARAREDVVPPEVAASEARLDLDDPASRDDA